GGHCRAQLDRFESLWRVEVFISGEVKASLDAADLALLKRGINILLLGMTDDGGLVDGQALELARELARRPDGPYAGKEPTLQLAARGKSPRYPMGASTIRALFGLE